MRLTDAILMFLIFAVKSICYYQLENMRCSKKRRYNRKRLVKNLREFMTH